MTTNDAVGEKVRIGLLSTAGINRYLLETRDATAPYDFVAVASREPARAHAYAQEWGIEKPYESYDALLDDPSIDAVYIALPNALHHQWAIRALAAGKHVLSEKPYTRDPENVREAFDIAIRKKLVFTEGYMWRHNPRTRELPRLLETIGDLRTIRATFCFRMKGNNNLRLVPELGGGAFLDVGGYCVSAARYLIGEEPLIVHGAAIRGPTGIDEQFAGILRFENVIAEFVCGFTHHHKTLEVIGTEGSIFIPEPWSGNGTELVVNGEHRTLEPANSYRYELEDFAKSIRGEIEPLLGQQELTAQARTLDALLRASETNIGVEL